MCSGLRLITFSADVLQGDAIAIWNRSDVVQEGWLLISHFVDSLNLSGVAASANVFELAWNCSCVS